MIGRCPFCERLMQVSDDAIGGLVTCSGCRREFTLEPKMALAAQPTPPRARQGPLDADGRMRVRNAAGMMMGGVVFTVLLAICATALALYRLRGSWVQLAGSVSGAALLLIAASIVFVGVRSLARLKWRGLCIAAAIISVLLGLRGIFGFVAAGASMIGADLDILLLWLALVSLLQAIICSWAGVRTLILVFRPEVIQAFRFTGEHPLDDGDFEELPSPYVAPEQRRKLAARASNALYLLAAVLFVHLVGLLALLGIGLNRVPEEELFFLPFLAMLGMTLILMLAACGFFARGLQRRFPVIAGALLSLLIAVVSLSGGCLLPHALGRGMLWDRALALLIVGGALAQVLVGFWAAGAAIKVLPLIRHGNPFQVDDR